jgi:hypothetical protein
MPANGLMLVSLGINDDGANSERQRGNLKPLLVLVVMAMPRGRWIDEGLTERATIES